MATAIVVMFQYKNKTVSESDPDHKVETPIDLCRDTICSAALFNRLIRFLSKGKTIFKL